MSLIYPRWFNSQVSIWCYRTNDLFFLLPSNQCGRIPKVFRGTPFKISFPPFWYPVKPEVESEKCCTLEILFYNPIPPTLSFYLLWIFWFYFKLIQLNYLIIRPMNFRYSFFPSLPVVPRSFRGDKWSIWVVCFLSSSSL